MIPERVRRLYDIHMQVAYEYANMSFATRKKVGAMLVKGDSIIDYGWNGMPSGFPNDEIEMLVDGELVTNPLVMHAESNALMKALRAGRSTIGADLIVTMSPCLECAKLIKQAGIARVFYREKYRITTSLDFLARANIEVFQI
jgi:dCMP deaminase